jgi:hypothetical protein
MSQTNNINNTTSPAFASFCSPELNAGRSEPFLGFAMAWRQHGVMEKEVTSSP